MDPRVNGMNVAILVTDGFDQTELAESRKALEGEGASIRIVSDKPDTVRGADSGQPGETVPVDLVLQQADAKAFDAIVLPGGPTSADALRDIEEAQRFLRNFQADNKPIAAIGEGVQLLVSARVIQGRTLTGPPALMQAVRDAGGNWEEQDVARDGNLVSGRQAASIAVFNERMIDAIADRMEANLRGTADEHAVGIASS